MNTVLSGAEQFHNEISEQEKSTFYWLCAAPFIVITLWASWACMHYSTDMLFASSYARGKHPLVDREWILNVGGVFFAIASFSSTAALFQQRRGSGALFLLFVACFVMAAFSVLSLTRMNTEAKARLYTKEQFISQIQHDLPHISERLVLPEQQTVVLFHGANAKVTFYSQPYSKSYLDDVNRPEVSAYLENDKGNYFKIVYRFNDDSLRLERVSIEFLSREAMARAAVQYGVDDAILRRLGFQFL